MEIMELTAFILRFAAPILALMIMVVCFVSLAGSRRDDHALIVLDDDNMNIRYPVIFWENLIGRSDKADIHIEDMTVSREHAVLLRRDDGWFVSDMGSKAGVYVNDVQIEGRCPIYIGDKITLGTSVLTLRRVDSPSPQNQRTKIAEKHSFQSVSGSFLLSLLTFYMFLITAEEMIYIQDITFLIPIVICIVEMWVFHKVSIKFFHRENFELEVIALLLSGTGVVMCSTYTPRFGYMQCAAMAIGFCMYSFIIWFIKVPDRIAYWKLIMAVAAMGLLASAVIFGTTINGASNWIIIGPFSFQPSEFAKIAYIFVGACSLDKLNKIRNLVGFLIVTAVCIGLLFYISDYGTGLIFFVVFVLIAYMRSGDWRTIVFSAAAAVIGGIAIIEMKPYIAERFSYFGNIWEYAQESTYQQARVLINSASGGLFGLGIGNGNLRLEPEAESDLVFGAISEEMGLLAALIFAAAIGGLMIYARSVTIKSRSVFYSMLACSTGGLFVFQAALHIFGICGILPLTGVTLPFTSYGGTSMMACWGLLAFIKCADERTYRQKKQLAISN